MSVNPLIPMSVGTVRLVKQPDTLSPRPHLLDYARTCEAFDWGEAAKALDSLPRGGGLNIAHEALDRHVLHGHGERVAIRWLGKTGERRELTYADLARATNRFANALTRLGVEPGERVFMLMGRLPELYVAVLGALKARCVVTPLFSAFGPEPIATRAEMGDARVLVTTPELYRRKVRGLRERLPGLAHVILVGEADSEPGVQRWDALVETASDDYMIAPTDAGVDGAAALHQRHHRPAQGRDPCARGRASHTP